MVKRLTTTRSSVAVVLDREILRQAELAPGADVHINVVGKTIVISAAELEVKDEEMEETLDYVDEHFGHALKRLAQ